MWHAVRNRAIKGNRLQDDPEAEIRRQDFKTTKKLLKFYYIKEREWSRKNIWRNNGGNISQIHWKTLTYKMGELSNSINNQYKEN